jgi:presenilin-like A22 family membrane protease
MERRIGGRQLLNIVVFFLIAQFGGFLLTVNSLPLSAVASYTATATASYQPTPFNVFIIVIEVILITMLILYVFNKYHGELVFLIFDGFVIIPGSAITFWLVLRLLFPALNSTNALILGIIFAIIFMAIKQKKQKLRNIAVLTSVIGFGVLFGISVGFQFCYLFLALLALYDYIAVFVTKHMITLANIMVQKNISAFVGSSDVHMVPNQYVSKSDRAEIAKSGLTKKIKDPVIRDMTKKGNTPFISQVALGNGDLLAPLMLATGAYVGFSDFFIPIFVIVGSTVGVIATLAILKRYQVALPAIPPIFAFENLFLGIAFLIYGQRDVQLSLYFFSIFRILIAVMLYTLNRGVEQTQKRILIHS